VLTETAHRLLAGFEVADSGRCRSAFRDDGDHDSGLMPINIPG